MTMRLVFFKLEIKRALKRLPQMIAGAVVLLFLAGTTALFASRALYGETAAGRIPVGVVVPEDDVLAQKVIAMIGSLDSVKGLCDFQYLNREEGRRGLADGSLYAVMEVPEGMVEGIMDGSNPPVQVIFPAQAGVESGIFRELTEAGAQILSSAQAGIYAGNELCLTYGMESEISQMERDLNKIFLAYSLPREDYFRHVRVSATGELGTAEFYGISASVLLLLLCAVPVSGYLLPWRRTMKQKLCLAGVGPASRAAGRILGLGLLFVILTVLLVGTAGAVGVLPGAAGSGGLTALDWLLAGAVFLLADFAAASMVVCLYQIGGNLLGGIMLLFLTVTAQHFAAGGFLPLVFLPASMQRIAGFLPSRLLMEGAEMAFTASWRPGIFAGLAALAAVAAGLSVLWEVKEG